MKMNETWGEIDARLKRKTKFVMAVVMKTFAFAPEKEGAIMLIDEDGGFQGSLCGGCVEKDVAGEAIQALKQNEFKALEYEIEETQARKAGMLRGGKIIIGVIPFTNDSESGAFSSQWQEAFDLINQKISFALVFKILGNQTETLLLKENFAADDAFSMKEKNFFASKNLPVTDFTGLVKIDGNDYFIFSISPENQLIIIGRSPINNDLLKFCEPFGFHTVLIEPQKSDFRSEEFEVYPDCVLQDEPEYVLSKLNLHKNTYAVLLTRDYETDDAALEILLNSPAKCIGVLSSRENHEKRVGRLLEKGFSQDQINRIHSPVGLELKAGSVSEVALSIASQLILVKNSG